MSIAQPAITGLRRLINLLLIAVVSVSLGVLVLGRVVPLLGHQTLVVAGPSMEPAIPMGAAVILDKVPATSLAVGDVVSLQTGPARAVFTHRIIRLAERDGAVWLESQGDANHTADPSITPATAVLGRVSLTIPLAGYLIALYSTPSGVLFALSLGLMLLMLGVLLEPRGERPAVQPAQDPALDPPFEPALMAPPVSVPVFERSSVQEVVIASRERRVRRARSGGGTKSRRPATGT